MPGKLNAAAVAALAPRLFKPSHVDVLTAWCEQGRRRPRPGLPFYFYEHAVDDRRDVPGDGTAGEVAADRVPTLAGAKFTNPDLTTFQRLLRLRDGQFDVLWGTDEYLLAALALGGEGAVGGQAELTTSWRRCSTG